VAGKCDWSEVQFRKMLDFMNQKTIYNSGKGKEILKAADIDFVSL
jgi:hypothetical protein